MISCTANRSQYNRYHDAQNAPQDRSILWGIRGWIVKIDDRRIHPREATQIHGRSSLAGRSPAARRQPSGHTDRLGATQPWSTGAGPDAPARAGVLAVDPSRLVG